MKISLGHTVSGRWLIPLFVLSVIGCEEGQACKVAFYLEGKQHIAEWWEQEGAPSGKFDGCAKYCSDHMAAKQQPKCTNACTGEPLGCMKKTRLGW
jgi:hypothetical protein